MPGSASPPASRCTSATRTRPGSGAATRTRTGCCASTSPGAPTTGGYAKWPRRRGSRAQRPPSTNA